MARSRSNSTKVVPQDDWTIEQFRHELVFQCDLVMFGWNELRGAVAKEEKTQIWYHIHAILSAVARIRKVLRSAGSPLKKLRTSLEIGDFRNHLEHFEERLQKWLALQVGCIADRNIDFGGKPIAQITRVQGREVRELRRYEARTSTVWFQGERLQLAPIVGAVKDLRGSLSACGCKFH